VNILGKIQKGNKELGCRDDFDATIIKSSFGFEKENIHNDIPSLIFTLEDKDGVASQVAFNTGSGWQIVDDGRQIEHKFRKNVVRGSMYGFFQERVLVGLKVNMRGRGKPTEADTWTGLMFHWKIEEISPVVSLPNEKTGKIIHLLPTKYLGGLESSNITPEEELLQLFELIKPSIPIATYEKWKSKLLNNSQTK
jgi:hypothetical protein